MSDTTYANCREYSSTVKMIFGGETASAGPAAAAAPAPKPPAPLPAGLYFKAHITTPLDSDTAAAGDPIEAVLTAPIRDKKKNVNVPAGALLHGRLRSVKQITPSCGSALRCFVIFSVHFRPHNGEVTL